jgi:hypothetical protein
MATIFAIFLHNWPTSSYSLQYPHEPNSVTLKMEEAHFSKMSESTYNPTQYINLGDYYQVLLMLKELGSVQAIVMMWVTDNE